MKIKRRIYERIYSAAQVVRRWAVRGKDVLCGTSGGAAMDVALGLLISVVLGLIVLTACNNLFGTNIMPGVTDKINSMFNIS